MNGDVALDPQSCKEDIVALGSITPPAGHPGTNGSILRVPGSLHRLTEVRRAIGVPRRVLAQRLGITVQELRMQEEAADLSLGRLCQWALVLNVPITDLVVERDECLAPTHLAESQATRLMKVAAKLRDRTRRRSVQRLAQTFVDQLAEILPVLEQLAQKHPCRPGRPNRSPAGLARQLSEHVFTRPRETDED